MVGLSVHHRRHLLCVSIIIAVPLEYSGCHQAVQACKLRYYRGRTGRHPLPTLLRCQAAVLSQLGWFDLYGLVGASCAQLDWMGQFLDKANHLNNAIATLVIISISSYMRYTRTNMLEVLNADYIRTARARGLSEHTVIYKHAFRNTLIPLVTIIGGSLPGLFSGALITETLFSIPGIGYISYQSMVAGDIPFTMFYLSFMAVLTLASNLLTDILYGVVDPRVRIS